MIPCRQPQHCDHECVCPDYSVERINQGRPCTMKRLSGNFNCQHDSRPHTSAPAPASSQSYGQNDQIPPCKDCPCVTPHCRKNCRYYEMYLLGAKAAREQEATRWYEGFKEYCIGECYFTVDEMMDFIESLRAQQEAEKPKEERR